ncbi:MAG: VTT domain-containing protein [Promethearchaeota archaeon]
MKLKKVDYCFLVSIAIITFLSVDLLLNSSHRKIIEDISLYAPFQNLGVGLLITFWVCLVGNLLPVPTPYTFVVCFSSLPFLQQNFLIPLLVGFVASLGCLVGEMAGYLIGRGASGIVSEDRTEKLKQYQHYLVKHPKLAPFLIFLFGFTPLNDDMITIPLGLIRYSAKKTIFWVWLGKLGLMLVFAYNLANICSFLGGENWILSIVTLYFTVILVYLMLRIDFIKVYNKLKKSV